MTEHDTPEQTTPAEFDLDAWINGGSVSQRSVPIYSRPDLYAQYEEWKRRYDAAEARAKRLGDEAGVGEGSELADLEVEGERIYADWMESKATWFVRALDAAEIDEINAAIPKADPSPRFTEKPPVEPRDHKGDKPSAAYTAAYEAWQARREAFYAEHAEEIAAAEKAQKAAIDEANLRMVAKALVRIEFAKGGATYEVTVDQLRAIRRQIGSHQILSLINAALAAFSEEPEIPAPFSRSTSRTDQD